MSAAARSFWADSRRVDNTRLKTELEIELRYPSYRDGLRAILSADKPSLDGLG